MVTDWVDCPICGEPDMRKETDSEGNSLIFCVNHACKSNGGDYMQPGLLQAERNQTLEDAAKICDAGYDPKDAARIIRDMKRN